ncbi:MAG: hypothetical protein U0525_00630 [Patescibacteria group bacterium]
MKIWLVLSNIIIIVLSTLLFYVIYSSAGAINYGLLIISTIALINAILGSRSK